ncbi:hypothetical protein COPEUT_02655 [Coprococcus eutactus ATCC 27759]|nr:hypothetical protein COPEUT_02655 [Coprococcus eutactus ATCC 27759]
MLELLSGIMLVAPFAGAWIEILMKRVRLTKEIVAPFAGAWIEMSGGNGDSTSSGVAPFAGAWIEMYSIKDIDRF